MWLRGGEARVLEFAWNLKIAPLDGDTLFLWFVRGKAVQPEGFGCIFLYACNEAYLLRGRI